MIEEKIEEKVEISEVIFKQEEESVRREIIYKQGEVNNDIVAWELLHATL